MPGTTAFPAALDTFPDIEANTPRNEVGKQHHAVHNNEMASTLALQVKVGIDGSADPDSLDYRVAMLEGQALPASVAVQFTAETGSTADSDPGAGQLRWNHAAPELATELYLDDLSADGAGLTALWAHLNVGGLIQLQHASSQNIWRIYEITAIVAATGYAKLTVDHVVGSGAFTDADSMLVQFEQGPSAAPGLADGDYGDITVSGSGAVMTIDAGAVSTGKLADGATTYAKMQDVSATDMLLGRSTAGSGDVEEIPCTAAGRALLDDATAAAQRTTLGLGTTNSPSFYDVILDRVAGASRSVAWRTAGINRWLAQANSTAEGVANAGSDWVLQARADDGSIIGNAILVMRATMAMTLGGVLTLASTPAVQDNSLKSASTAYVDRAAVIPLIVAVGDETTAITAGSGKVTFRMPYAATLIGVRASCNTAPTGATIIIDINESGVSVLSTKLSIDTTEKTSTTAAVPAVISDTALADDAEITIDFDQVGSTIAGAGVKVTLLLRKAA